MNEVKLLGRLGSDWKLRTTPNGTSVASVSIATNSYNPKGADYTEWHNLVAWGKTAEALAKYTSKGQRLLICGSLRNREYDKDGVTRYITEIYVREFEFIEKKPDEVPS